MSVQSCLYEGVVRHRRSAAAGVGHAFAFPLFLVYLDLAELPGVFRGRWLWSTSRPAPARFRREDHLGDPRTLLDAAVRDLVEARRGVRPTGPVRLLTHLRHFGYVFNPVSFFYCFDATGRRVETVVAEVSNTPWNERHCYVLTPETDTGRGAVHRWRTPKEFHVSPFLGMGYDYAWTFREPGEHLSVVIRNLEPGAEARGPAHFEASLVLHRRPLTTRAMAGVLLRHPAMTLRTIAGIYAQAWRLRRKGAPHHPHPGRPAALAGTASS